MGPAAILGTWAVTVGERHTIGFQLTSTVTENQESHQKGLPPFTVVHARGPAAEEPAWSLSQEAPSHLLLFREYKAPNTHIQQLL